MAIDCYNVGYKLGEWCKAFNIPNSSLRDHLSGRTKSRKIGAKTIFIKYEEDLIIEYMDEMIEVGHLLHIKKEFQRTHGYIGLSRNIYTWS